MPQDIQELIQFLKTNGFRAECPHCTGKMDLSETPLFDAENFTPEAKELLKEKKIFNKERRQELKYQTNKKLQIIDIETGDGAVFSLLQ